VKKAFLVIGLAVTLFAFHSFEYFYADYLRAQAKSNGGTTWTETVTNGQTTFAVPWLSNIDYITKINAIRQTGVPGDPYSGDTRLKSWLLDSAMHYIIYGWCRLFKRLDIGFTFFAFLCPSLWFIWAMLYFRKLLPESDFWERVFYSLLMSEFLQAFIALSGGFSVGKALYHAINFGVMYRGAVSCLPSPLFSSLFAVAWWGWFSLSRGKSILTNILLGLCAGLMPLVHPPEYIFCLGVIGMTYILSAENRARTMIILCLALVVGIICLSFGGTFDRAEKMQSIATQGRWATIPYLVAGVVCIWRSAKADKLFWSAVGSTLIMVAIAVNLDLVINVPLEMSVLERFLKPVILIALIKLAHDYVGPQIRAVARVAVGVMLCVVFFNAKSSAEKHYLFAGLPIEWEEHIDWLNNKTDKGSIVLTMSPLLSKLIATHTHNRQIIGDGHPTIGSTPRDENLKNTGILANTLGIGEEEFVWRYYTPTNGDLNKNLYYNQGDISEFMFCLDGFVNVSQYPRQPFLDPILKSMRENKKFSKNYTVWMSPENN